MPEKEKGILNFPDVKCETQKTTTQMLLFLCVWKKCDSDGSEWDKPHTAAQAKSSRTKPKIPALKCETKYWYHKTWIVDLVADWKSSMPFFSDIQFNWWAMGVLYTVQRLSATENYSHHYVFYTNIYSAWIVKWIYFHPKIDNDSHRNDAIKYWPLGICSDE